MSDQLPDERPPFQLSLRAILVIVAGFAAVLAIWRWSLDWGLIATAGYGSLLLVVFAFAYGRWPTQPLALLAAFLLCLTAWSTAWWRIGGCGDKVLPVQITVHDRVTQRSVAGAQVEFYIRQLVDSATSDSGGVAVCRAEFFHDFNMSWRYDRRYALPNGEVAVTAQGFKPFRRALIDLGAQPWDYRQGPLEVVIELEPK